MDFLNSALRAGKAVVMNIPEMELKVEEATDNKPWGPSGTQMLELAKATMSFGDFPVIMSAIWKRMMERDKEQWRTVYKSLALLEYLMRNGSEQVIPEARVHTTLLHSLTEYYHQADGKDQGLAVREKAKAILQLLHDERRLYEERDAATQNRRRFQESISSDGRVSTPGYSGGGSGGDSYSGYSGGGYGGGGYSGGGSGSGSGYGGSAGATGRYVGFGSDSIRPQSDHGSGSGGESPSYRSAAGGAGNGTRNGRSAPSRQTRYDDTPNYSDSRSDNSDNSDEEDEDLERFAPRTTQPTSASRTGTGNRNGNNNNTARSGTGTTTAGSSGRPRAPSNGAIETPAAPTLKIDDLLSLPTAPPTPTPPVTTTFPAFGQTTTTVPPVSSTTGVTGGGSFFTPEWGAFSTPTTSQPPTTTTSPYLPLGTQQQQLQQQQQQQSRAADPWARKDLFTLDLKPEQVSQSHGPGISPAAAAVARQGVHDYSSLRQVSGGPPVATPVAYVAAPSPYGGAIAQPISPYGMMAQPISPYGASTGVTGGISPYGGVPTPSPYGASSSSSASSSTYGQYSNSSRASAASTAATLNWPANYGSR